MHELGLALEIVDIATRSAAGRRVTRVVVEVGKLAAVLPEALQFCFELAIENTPLAGAELEIVSTMGRARCRACGGAVALERPFGRCVCQSSDLEWLSGDELKIKAMEVA